MLATFLVTFALIAVSVAGLAAGVLLGRKPLRGSCGGLSCGTCKAAREMRP